MDGKVSFNLSGKPFVKNGETLYFTNLQAWRLEAANAGGGNFGGAPASASAPAQAPTFYSSDADNDLPF